jgi:uncharacterized protein YjbI with pentapeptide repeats
MTDAQALCGFKSPEHIRYFGDPDYQCRHPARQDGLCLFHLLKPTEEQKQAMAHEACTAAEAIEEEFRQAFSKLLEDEEKNPEVKVHDFRFFHFPAIDLSRSRFAKPLRLAEAIFSGEADFGRATFSGRADFGMATFSGRADFGMATFSGRADFGMATFSEEASFWVAAFSGRADFGRATFSGRADFGMATFSEEASFWMATFSGRADFGMATFSGGAKFGRATFSGETDFRGETFRGVCLFTEVTLDEKAEVIFEKANSKANLTQASFLDTNLERIHFRDVDWPRKGRRQALWDEFPHEGGQPNYEKVAENYRQLVLNYEAKRDFDTAEDFHVGEMEMRRKKKRTPAEIKAAEAKSRGMKMLWHCWGTIREWTNGYSIYKLLSNYGTNYWQGFLVLVVLLALFSGIFLCTGLKPSKEA